MQQQQKDRFSIEINIQLPNRTDQLMTSQISCRSKTFWGFSSMQSFLLTMALFKSNLKQ